MAVRAALALGAAVVVALVPAAHAQSRRYPAAPVDTDREAAARSRLWERATTPSAEPYQRALAEAREALAQRLDTRTAEAIEAIGEAIALAPDRPEAYALRAEAHLQLRQWRQCAADLEDVLRRPASAGMLGAPRPAPGAALSTNERQAQGELRRKLGLCLARAGRLAEAERVLAEATAGGTGTGEMLMRLGEVRIAMGKLDEAIGALTAALDTTDLPSQALTRWLLAAAYDRARLPAEAIAQARQAAGYDRSFGALTGDVMPLLGAGETEYLLGLAWSLSRVDNEPPRPEHALVYFRRFLALAPHSPWRRRAEEHLAELRTASLPEAIERKGGTASLDLDVARGIGRTAMPAMRACLARTPTSILEVLITRAGPRSARPAPRNEDPFVRRRNGTYGVAAPPEGVSIAAVPLPGETASRADLDAAIRCVELLADRIVLPAVTDKDTWYKVGLFVVSP